MSGSAYPSLPSGSQDLPVARPPSLQPSSWILRIKASFVPPSDVILSTSSPVPTYYTLLGGTVPELLPYLQDGDCRWILKVASLIFGPYAAGTLYFSPSPDPSTLREVVTPTRSFEAGVYEFEPEGICEIAKCCKARNASKTTAASKNQSTSFESSIAARDLGCSIVPDSVWKVASHLIPKRLGDARVMDIIEASGRFPAYEVSSYSRYDPRIGILADPTIGMAIEVFQLGFFHLTDSTYEIQAYTRNPYSLEGHFGRAPIVHRLIKSLVSHSSTPLPPPAVFDWHWLQCVYGRFGTDIFAGPSWCYYVRDLVEDDEDDESEDDPSYPSAEWDKVVRAGSELQEKTRVQLVVQQWQKSQQSVKAN